MLVVPPQMRGREALLRADWIEGRLANWDPGWKLPGEGIIKRKGRLKPTITTRWVSTPATNQEKPGRAKTGQKAAPPAAENNHAPVPIHHRPILPSRS